MKPVIVPQEDFLLDKNGIMGEAGVNYKDVTLVYVSDEWHSENFNTSNFPEGKNIVQDGEDANVIDCQL